MKGCSRKMSEQEKDRRPKHCKSTAREIDYTTKMNTTQQICKKTCKLYRKRVHCDVSGICYGTGYASTTAFSAIYSPGTDVLAVPYNAERMAGQQTAAGKQPKSY